MHGVGPEPLIDQIGPDDFRRHAGVDVFIGKTPRGVFGQQQFPDVALRIAERRRHRVPAIENDRTVDRASRSRQAGRRPASRPLPGTR